jgi:hypothetical protein
MVDPVPDLERCTKITERFFDRVLEAVFGLKRDMIRISSIIKIDEVRRHLLSAEKALDEGRYLESVVSSRDALDSARFHWRETFDIESVGLLTLFREKADNPDAYWFYKELIRRTEQIELGMDHRRLNRFMDYMSRIPSEYRLSEHIGHIIMQRDWNVSDAKYCYRFASDMALKWQSEALEDVDPPRGVRLVQSYEMFFDGKTTGRFDDSLVNVGENGEVVERMIIDRAGKSMLEGIKEGCDCEITTRYYYSGGSSETHTRRAVVKGVLSRCLTQNPERWQCIVWLAGD